MTRKMSKIPFFLELQEREKMRPTNPQSQLRVICSLPEIR